MKNKTRANKPAQKLVKPSQNSIQQKFSEKTFIYIILGAILLLAFLLFYQARNFDFINYDDDVYVLGNTDIRNLSWEGIKKIFFNPENPEHIKPPLTIVSLAINHYFGGFNPKGYHLVNILFHLGNILMLFAVMRKYTQNIVLSLFVAAFFAIHPFNVEPVSWVTARKEVQYTFFYLLGMYYMHDYFHHRKIWQYLIVFIAFLLSFYSKFAAVTFPVLYLAIAFLWLKRKNYFQAIAESIPFFFVPVYPMVKPFFQRNEFVHQTSEMVSQPQVVKTILGYGDFGFIEKFFLGGYSFFQYLVKYFAPINLRLIYPYPQKTNGLLPLEYYLFSALALLIVGIVLFYYVKKKWYNNKTLNFGLIFFFLHISLLLHILPIGGRVVMAERYMYLPQIGLLVVLFYAIHYLLENFSKHKKNIRYFLIGFFAFCLMQSIFRVPVWANSKSVFTDLIEKEPTYPVGYNNLGSEYLNERNYQQALHYFQKAAELAPTYADALSNAGVCYAAQKQFTLAEQQFNKAIEANGRFVKVFYHMGKLFFDQGKLEEAIVYYEKSIELDPSFYISHNNLGGIYRDNGDLEKALEYYNLAVKYNPYLAMAYCNRGLLYWKDLNNLEMAILDFDKALETDPAYMDAYINRAYVRIEKNDLYGGISDFTSALGHTPRNARLLIDRAKTFYMAHQPFKACDDLKIAVSMGDQEAKQLQEMICR